MPSAQITVRFLTGSLSMTCPGTFISCSMFKSFLVVLFIILFFIHLLSVSADRYRHWCRVGADDDGDESSDHPEVFFCCFHIFFRSGFAINTEEDRP